MNIEPLSLKCVNSGKVFTYYGTEAYCLRSIRDSWIALYYSKQSKRRDKTKKDVIILRDGDVNCCDNPSLEY